MSNSLSAFVTCRHNGEDPSIIEPMLAAAQDGLRLAGVASQCAPHIWPQFDREDHALDHAFSCIQRSDVLVVVQRSNFLCPEVMMYIGFCRRDPRIPVILARRVDVTNIRLIAVADDHFTWANDGNLGDRLEQIDFSQYDRRVAA
jgi:hypothetical protein